MILGVRNITSRRSLAPLLVGILVGFFVATIFISAEPKSLWLTGFSRKPLHADLRDPHSSVDLTDAEGPEKDVGFHSNEGAHAHENKSIAQQLYNDVRILCWIMTNPQNHQRKARHVKRTWGSRCNKLIFMSSTEGMSCINIFCLINWNVRNTKSNLHWFIDPELESVALPVKEGRNNLWAKTKEAFKYIYNNHMDDADWFLKADDDTYVILENLRYMLYPYSPTFPIYMGCKFKPFVNQVS